MEDLSYLLALHLVDGLGSARLKKLLDFYKSAKDIWDKSSLSDFKSLSIPEAVYYKFKEQKKSLDPEDYLLSLTKKGIKILTFFDEDYPKDLKEIYDPPLILYYKGEILKEDDFALGVVGTRKVTGYGAAVTEQLVTGLVEAGFTIVSGLARGVDTLAHKTAVKLNGRTIAVLGGGINSIFPPENLDLARKIADSQGAYLSEHPPSYPHLAGNFPTRNRIIAGMSQAVLVTEAAFDSGSLITAKYALEYGKDVFAVPGPITSSLSEGPLELIKNGARLVTSVEDILNELGISQKPKVKGQKNVNLNEHEKKILELIENEQKHIDDIARELKIPISQISGSLIKLEIMGVVKNMGSGVYVKNG